MKYTQRVPVDADKAFLTFDNLTVIGGFPKGGFARMGIAVFGNDANGAPLTFYTLIEF